MIVFLLCNSHLIYGSAIRENAGAFFYTRARTSESAKSRPETALKEVSQGPSITYSQKNVSCYGGFDGTINVIIAAPDGTETYLWSDDSTITTSNRNGLFIGSYTVTVTNSSGSVSQTITITQPSAALTATLTGQTDVLCFGQSTGSAVISPSGGTAPYVITPAQTGLAAGLHTFTVTDNNGCTTTVDATITQPSAALSSAISVQTNVLCFGSASGSVTVVGLNGTSPYQYSLNSGPFQTSGTFSSLYSGAYTVMVQDAAGCTTVTNVTITQPSLLSISAMSSNTPICQGSTLNLEVTAAGGTPVYSYSWSGPNSYTSISQNPVISNALPSASGTYTVSVSDANGCIASSGYLSI